MLSQLKLQTHGLQSKVVTLQASPGQLPLKFTTFTVTHALVCSNSGKSPHKHRLLALQVSERYPGGCSKGELTKEGQLQAQDFGRWLRWRYVMIHEGFLPEKFQVCPWGCACC